MRYRPPSNRWDEQFEIDYEQNLKDIESDIVGTEQRVTDVDSKIDSIDHQINTRMDEIETDLVDVTNKATHFDDVDEELAEQSDLIEQLKASSIDGEVIAARNGFPSLLDFLKSLNSGTTIANKTFTATAGQTTIDLTDTGELQAVGKVIMFLIDDAPQWSNYTWTNSKTLTMKSAFIGGEQVVIRYFVGNVSIRTGHGRGHEKGGFDELDVYKLKNGDVIRDDIKTLQEETVRKKQLSFNILDYGATGTGDDTEAIQKVLDYIETAQPNFPFAGGEVFFPLGVYNITSLNIKTTISIKGAGFSTVLRVSGSINTPSELSKKLLMSDIRLVGTGSGTLMNINKTWAGSSSVTFQLKNIWFHNENGTGLLLDVYGARESGITDCWFTSGITNNTGTTDAIRFRADSIGGAMNIDVKGCQFHHLRSGILGVGDPNNHQLLAGLRLIDNMFIGLFKGIDIQHADYVLIEQSMMDFVDHPVYCNRTANLKIRNSYFAVRGDNNDAVVIENTKAGYIMRWLDIQNNRIFSYATTKGNAIVVHANGGDIAYGNITNNDIDLVNCSILLKGSLGGLSRQIKINGNRSVDVSTFISLGEASENNQVEYNYAEISATNFITNNNPNGGNRIDLGNVHGSKRSKNEGRVVNSGDGVKTVFSIPHNLLLTPRSYHITKGNSGIADKDFYVTADSSNIYVNFLVPPINGVNNVVLMWNATI